MRAGIAIVQTWCRFLSKRCDSPSLACSDRAGTWRAESSRFCRFVLDQLPIFSFFGVLAAVRPEPVLPRQTGWVRAGPCPDFEQLFQHAGGGARRGRKRCQERRRARFPAARRLIASPIFQEFRRIGSCETVCNRAARQRALSPGGCLDENDCRRSVVSCAPGAVPASESLTRRIPKRRSGPRCLRNCPELPNTPCEKPFRPQKGLPSETASF